MAFITWFFIYPHYIPGIFFAVIILILSIRLFLDISAIKELEKTVSTMCNLYDK